MALKICQKYNIDYSQIQGTGGRGRITKRDVEEFRKQLKLQEEVAAHQPQPQTAAPGAKVGAGLEGMRKIIAQNMMHSLHSTAQLSLHRSIDITELLAVIRKLKEEIADPEVTKSLSLNVVMLKAVGLALQKYPALNARYDGQHYEQVADINIGIAVALANGLAVPTVANVPAQSLTQLRSLFVDRVERARTGDIDTKAAGTFTITNLGAEGIEYFTPVLNVPEVAILGIGALQHRLELDEQGELLQRSFLPLSLTIDHQTIDGQVGAHFLGEIAQIVQNPYRLLL